MNAKDIGIQLSIILKAWGINSSYMLMLFIPV